MPDLKNDLNKDEKQLLLDMFMERSRTLSDASREGISRKIREVSQEEYKDTMDLWQKMTELLKLEE